MSSESYTGVVQKNDADDAELEQESKALEAVEEELKAAEARVASAETRYRLAREQVAKELAKPLVEEKHKARAAKDTPTDADAAAKLVESQEDLTKHESRGSKNTGAMTDKQVSSQRWIANRAAEGRVRDATRRARERLRRGQRDQRSEFAEPDALQDGAESPVKAEAKPDASEATRARAPSADLTEGAQGIAERVKNHPEAAEKRTSLVRVLIGERENVYTFELTDVVADLKERGLVEAQVADDLSKLLSQPVPADKEASVPRGEWLAHAQKISKVEPLDKPLNKVETMYLKWLEEKRIGIAEAELAAAERKLQQALSQAESRYPQIVQETPKSSPKQRASGEPKVDIDEAVRLEAMHDPDLASRGAKNTSAMSEKEVSREKWEAARGEEGRAKEKDVKARDARRTEARDRKFDAADAPNDDA